MPQLRMGGAEHAVIPHEYVLSEATWGGTKTGKKHRGAIHQDSANGGHVL